MWTMLLLKAAPLLRLAKGKGKLIGVMVAIIGVFWYTNYLKGQIEDLKQEVQFYSSQLTEAQEANLTNQDAIRVLRGANESFSKALVITEEERVRATKEAEERESRAASQLDNTLSEMENLRNANPTCQQVSDIDLSAACPLVIDKLREHSAGTGSID